MNAKEGIGNNHINYFKLALDKACETDIYVSYQIFDGPAIAGKDDKSESRKVKIDVGKTQVMISVAIIVDAIF